MKILRLIFAILVLAISVAALVIALMNRHASSQLVSQLHQDHITSPIRPDYDLRYAFNLRSLQGEYRLNKEKPYFQVAYLEFENGKEVSAHLVAFGNMIDSNDRRLDVDLIWGNIHGKQQMVTHISGMTSRGNVLDFFNFFKDFKENGSGVRSWDEEKYHGYHIVGFAQSGAAINPKYDGGSNGSFNVTRTSKKYVFAIAVKTSATSLNPHQDSTDTKKSSR